MGTIGLAPGSSTWTSPLAEALESLLAWSCRGYRTVGTAAGSCHLLDLRMVSQQGIRQHAPKPFVLRCVMRTPTSRPSHILIVHVAGAPLAYCVRFEDAGTCGQALTCVRPSLKATLIRLGVNFLLKRSWKSFTVMLPTCRSTRDDKENHDECLQCQKIPRKPSRALSCLGVAPSRVIASLQCHCLL